MPRTGVLWSQESLFWQLEAVGNLSDDMRRHFRMKLRNLLTKFIRKFG